MKQLTVQQIINMIDSGELNTNQSTQRKFVYSSISLEIGNKKPCEKSVFSTPLSKNTSNFLRFISGSTRIQIK